jgi:TPR repeat protein
MVLVCPIPGLRAAERTFAEQAFVLTPAQVQELTGQALDGSGDSALRLSRFYSNVTVDLDEALRWAIIGAENGDANCEFTAYALLHARVSPDDRRRSQFWLKKAAEQGYRPAVEALDGSR